VPRIGEAGSGTEFFVHHEDLRRARPGWQPRELDASVSDAIWRRARRTARFALRSVPAGIELVRTDTGERHLARAAKQGQPVVSLSGAASELLMYVYGRREHAVVETTGDVGLLLAG
jgi:uncharacterized protein (TIGR03085 family)